MPLDFNFLFPGQSKYEEINWNSFYKKKWFISWTKSACPCLNQNFCDKDCKYKYCELALRSLQSNAGNDYHNLHMLFTDQAYMYLWKGGGSCKVSIGVAYPQFWQAYNIPILAPPYSLLILTLIWHAGRWQGHTKVPQERPSTVNPFTLEGEGASTRRWIEECKAVSLIGGGVGDQWNS